MKVQIQREGLLATAIYDSDKNTMVVLKGSNYRLDTTPSLTSGHIEQRSELTDKMIVSDGVFIDDYEFTSPSAAAIFIVGYRCNGLEYWSDETGATLKQIRQRQDLFEYIENNINNPELENYIDVCTQTVNRAKNLFPLESLKDLKIEEWDKRGSTDTLTYLIEYGTSEMFSGSLGFNQNKLFYQDTDNSYTSTMNIISSYPGDNVYERFDNFINKVYQSFVRYDDDDYLNDTDNNYALVGANILFIKLLSFYNPEQILLLGSPTIFLRFFEYLGMGKFNGDSVAANIHLKRLIYDNISAEYHIYAVSKLLFDYYKLRIEPLYKPKEIVPDKIEALELEVDLSHIFVEDNKIQEILNVLDRKKNIILQGVPGVGKTFIIKSILKSKYNISENNYQTVQFHQSYAYEEFIEGLRPIETSFEVSDGIFKTFAKRAESDPDNQYFFVIDEINRGNLSKIFGELLMLIESDKRDNYAVQLPYSKEQFTVPSNLYIIGTMNTADRSLSLVDYALRRRFSFITLRPAFNTEKFNEYMVNELGYEQKELDIINDKMSRINKMIRENLQDTFEIGHSYFIESNRPEDFNLFLNEVFKYEILPLIREYFFDDESLINEFKGVMGAYE